MLSTSQFLSRNFENVGVELENSSFQRSGKNLPPRETLGMMLERPFSSLSLKQILKY
jgi:hypothetical protein